MDEAVVSLAKAHLRVARPTDNLTNVVLSCIDSRAPAEVIMDLGIGDIFNARVAGNIANEDILGSLEFACKLAGAKVVLVMGHTACGANIAPTCAIASHIRTPGMTGRAGKCP